MFFTPARSTARYAAGTIVAACLAACLVACGTAPAPVPGPAPAVSRPALPATSPSASAGSGVTPKSPVPSSGDVAVQARFPEPAVNYRTPALQPGHAGPTSPPELSAWLRETAREGAPWVHLVNLGTSQNGLPLEGLLFTRHPEAGPEALQRSGRPTVLVIGQQQGDDSASAEALLTVARELAQGRLRTLWDRVNVLVVPRVNPDGAASRQHGTANGIDLDADHLQLKTPEAQALARLVRGYQPVVVVEAREYPLSPEYAQKYGAVQRHDALLQYASTGNLAPFITKAAEEWMRQPLLASLKAEGLSADWLHAPVGEGAERHLAMADTRPDHWRNAQGLRNAVSLVLASRGAGPAPSPLKRRVHTLVTGVASLLRSASDRSADLLKLRQYVDAEISAQACQGPMAVETALTPSEYTLQMLDAQTGVERTVTVNWDSALALREVKTRLRPCGYWLAADQADAVSRLRLLGLRVEEVQAKGVAQGETYEMAARPAAAGVSSGKEASRIEVRTTPALLDLPVGSFVVPLSQPWANLAIAALEPDAPGSYVAAGLISEVRKVSRLTALPQAKTAPVP